MTVCYGRNVRFLAVLLIFFSLLSCSVEFRKTTTYSSPIDIRSNLRSCQTKDWTLGTPVAGMFVGVSRYDDAAGVYSTAAHRIGAVAFHSPFRMAANNSSDEPRNAVSLRVLVDSYRPPSMPEWIHPARAYTGGWSSSNELVTRERIYQLLHNTVEAANRLHAEQGRVLMVLYIGGHGWIHSDGEAYVIPADSNPDMPGTWISYKSLIDTAGQFVGGDLSTGKRALVVLDTCQFERHEYTQHIPIAAPPGVMVLRASAPGQYAWHFTSNASVSQTIYGTEGYRISFPVPKPKGPKPGLKVQKAQSKMSVVPIAAGCELYDAKKDQQIFTLGTWGEQIAEAASSLLSTIPDLDRLGLRQDIQVDYGEGTRDFIVFRRKEVE